jgi:hypothetical protein
MINTDKYEGHSTGWKRKINYSTYSIINDDGHKVASIGGWEDVWKDKSNIDSQLITDAPLLLEFIQKVVEEWGKPNQCNKAFGKDVRHLMLEYGLINYNEETRRYEVKE